MAFRDYTDQVLKQGDCVRSAEAAEDIKQGQLLKYDSDDSARTVEPSDSDGEGGIAGVALYDASAGDDVAFAEDGTVVRATSGTGAISSGDEVASHGGTGEEGELAAAASGDFVVGRAVEDDAGSSDDVFVSINLGGTI
jgi:predicted transcriptional regulator